MSGDSEAPLTQDPALDVMDKAGRRRGWWLIGIAIVFALLTAGVALAVREADSANDKTTSIKADSQQRDVRIANLESALDAQRAQFEACKDKKAGAPGCVTAVAPTSSNIGPQGIPGTQGVGGPPGPTGPQGPQGLQGVPGQDGNDGSGGPQGPVGNTGSSGTNGVDGASGPKGDTGEQGPPGPQGPEGPQGPVGPIGPAITSFTYSDLLGNPHTCTDPDGDFNYTCD